MKLMAFKRCWAGLGLVSMFFLTIVGSLFLNNVSFAKEIKPGIIITKDNYGEYLTELRRLLPPAKHYWYIELGLKKGLITMPIVETKYFSPSLAIKEATKKGDGACKVSDKNQLIGWIAGYPFPNPKTAVELAWSAYPEISRASSADELSISNFWEFYGKDKYEKKVSMLLQKKKYLGRVRPPVPHLPEGKKRGVLSKESIVVREPFDAKGFIQMRIRYWDIDKEDKVYSYLPVLRRLRRLTGRDVADPILGSDYIFDDCEVWRQKLNSKMTFRILEIRNFLVPRTYTEHPPEESFLRGPCHQVDWEIRSLYVLEIITNDPDYVYSKRVVYIDKEEGNFNLYWGENYDHGGRLWRANGHTAPCDIEWKDYGRCRGAYGWMCLNNLSRHFTIMNFYPSFDTLDPNKAYTIKGLLRTAR